MAGHSLTQQLAQHLLRPVPPAMRLRARRHLLDWLGCVAGALRSPAAEAQRGFVGEAAVMRAAWLGNVLEMDDVHRAAILHPGPVVWPVALGEADAGMGAVLDAGVRGYEAMIAIGATFDAYHYARWHPTATAGVFGAAAAAASLIGSDADALVSALGLAGSVSGGVWRMRHEAGLAKQWHVAHAAATGRSAAWHTARGAIGPQFILEGEQGLHEATCETPRPMVLGEGWRLEEVSLKPWGACRHAHPAIDAALALKAGGRLEGAVTVATYRDALTFCDKPVPTSVIEAKFSIQHAVAVVMTRGVPALADFELDAIAALAEARAKVRVVEDAAFTARYPEHFGARVETAAGTIERIDTLGDPERPLGEEGIIAKARALMEWGGVSGDADAAIAACLEDDDPRTIVSLLEKWL